MKRVLISILLVVILVACNKKDNQNTSYAERDEGVVVNVEKDDTGSYLILTLPRTENINLLDKTRDELIKLAQENNGAFYKVSPEKFEELDLEIGQRIVGEYSEVGESDPPVRFTDNIEVISEQ
ncbi:hypothetical protein [Oceanobacillus massiliensis]|uniref:hypothetical protein n=1 Tax=Oceanobacillus massiliensis TaxID=1465765 RepID=UPI00301A4875